MFKKGTLTVGSSSYNDLVLHDAEVMPEHLRLEMMGNSIQVTHLDKIAAAANSSEGDYAPPKQEIWRPNSSIKVGQHTLTLVEISLADSSKEFAEYRMARALLGPGVDVARMGCIGTPLAQLVRMRGVLSIIFAVGLLFGTLSRWADRLPWFARATPTASVRTVVVTATPTATAENAAEATFEATPLPAPAQATVVTATVELLVPPTPTPTRVPILVATVAPVVIAAEAPVFVPVGPGGLIDGPEPPTAVPPPVEAVPSGTQLLSATAGEGTTGQPGESPTEVITLDKTLQQLGVWVEPAMVAPGEDYWRLASVRWLNAAEAQGRNTIMLEVVDKNGQRVIGQPLTIAWKDGSANGETNKPNPEVFSYDFPMNASGNAYSVQIDGAPSEILHGLGMGTVEEPLAPTKTSFYVTYQLATRQ
jgi:hypothetical protein